MSVAAVKKISRKNNKPEDAIKEPVIDNPARHASHEARIISHLALDEILPSPKNPRKTFDDASFTQLVASIREKGVLQPIIVRPIIVPADGQPKYELVAGERRWRASAVAGSGTIPAIIRDLNDDDAFDVMTIENLQREDLTEAEEARSFAAYVGVKGDGAIEDLASRSGISPRYIRRRVKVMELPEAVLKEWEDGTLAFGVLEQLLRLDPREVPAFCKEKMRDSYERRIDNVKRAIDNRAMPLGGALFKTKEAGCTSCGSNSKVQSSLFGDDFRGEKVTCQTPACFVEKQRTFLTENWPATAFAREHGTNGFRFSEEIPYDKKEIFYNGPPRETCKDCASFVSLIQWNGKVFYPQACVDRVCKSQSGDKSKPKQSRDLGPEFQDRFYREKIPAALEALTFNDQPILRIVAQALINGNERSRTMFFTKKGIKHEWNAEHKVWLALETMAAEEIIEWIRQASFFLVLEDMQFGFGLKVKHLVAKHLGIDLKTEWRLHEEYLKRKTIPEIIDLCTKLKLLEDPKVREFASTTLRLKNEKYDTLKKKDLIRLILESGVDLSGKVPKEILGKR